jgi:hypothetical protein
MNVLVVFNTEAGIADTAEPAAAVASIGEITGGAAVAVATTEVVPNAAACHNFLHFIFSQVLDIGNA